MITPGCDTSHPHPGQNSSDHAEGGYALTAGRPSAAPSSASSPIPSPSRSISPPASLFSDCRPRRAVREYKDRPRPPSRTPVTLPGPSCHRKPGARRHQKDGTAFDLPIAVAILTAQGPRPRIPSPTILLGELSLDGGVKGIHGAPRPSGRGLGTGRSFRKRRRGGMLVEGSR